MEAIETAAPTINEGNEDLIFPIDIVVEEERFKDGDRVEQNGTEQQPVLIQSIPVKQQQQKPKQNRLVPCNNKRKKVSGRKSIY